MIPITCPGASPPSAAGETSRSSAAACSRSAGGGALQQVQRRGRGAQVALAQARAERRSVVAHATWAELPEPLPLEAAASSAAEPLPLGMAAPLPDGAAAPTSSTMSRMMRVRSKSFGV